MKAARRTIGYKLGEVGRNLLSISKQSPDQEKYQQLFRDMCEEHNVEHPFELDADDTRAFFNELSERWAKEKEK